MKLKRNVATIVMAAGLILGTAAPAIAATVSSPGSEGKAYSNGEYVKVTDTEANGESVYSKYYIHGSNTERRIEVVSGNGTSEQSQDYDAGVNKFNACNNNNNFPDACSSYVNP